MSFSCVLEDAANFTESATSTVVLYKLWLKAEHNGDTRFDANEMCVMQVTPTTRRRPLHVACVYAKDMILFIHINYLFNDHIKSMFSSFLKTCCFFLLAAKSKAVMLIDYPAINQLHVATINTIK